MNLPHDRNDARAVGSHSERARAEFAQHVRDALQHMYDPVYLQTHPLAAWIKHDTSSSTTSVGTSLRQQLLQTITALRPGAETVTGSAAWRRYQILALRYVEGLDIAAVQERLAISSGTYFREQQRGIEAVISLLGQQWAVDAAIEEIFPPKGRPVLRALPGGQSEVLASPVLAEGGGFQRFPTPLTRFVGRELERAEVLGLLATGRLVTLTGPPGAGKTRLALAVAADASDLFPDGVFFVSLAHIRDANLAIAAIAQALGVYEDGGAPLISVLAETLHNQHVLIFLDNFEQVLAAGVPLAELLALAPNVTALVTSRAVLHVRGERDYVVPPLGLPATHRTPLADQLLDYPAIQLFVDRAREARPDFMVNDETAHVLVDVCRRLDGLPLAIELAAARVRLLPLVALSARLERRLPLLTSGPRDLPERQQTLRAAIDWSYDLLSLEAQGLFRRVAVFVDGSTLPALEAVCNFVPEPARGGALGGDGDGGAGFEDLLDVVTMLVDQSLLRLVDQSRVTSRPTTTPRVQLPARASDPRIVMLESVREYALERLEASGEQDTIRKRHAQYYVDFVVRGDAALRETDESAVARWYDLLEADYDNVRAALAWIIEHRDVEQSYALVGALGRFLEFRHYWTEGRQWIESVLALGDAGVDAAARAWALYRAGVLALAQGDFPVGRARLIETTRVSRHAGDKRLLATSLGDLGRVVSKHRDTTARPILEESLALFRELGDMGGVAGRLAELGFIATCEGNHTLAQPLLQETLSIWTRLGNRAGEGNARHLFGLLEMTQGEEERARAQFEQSLATFRELNGKQGIASALNRLSELDLQRGDSASAARRLEESLTLAREVRDKDTLAWAFKDQGCLARQKGDNARATRCFQDSLIGRREQGHAWGIAICLFELAEQAMCEGQHTRAVRLFAGAKRQHRESGALPCAGDLSGYDLTVVETHLVALKDALGPEAYATAWKEADSRDLETIIGEALDSGIAP